MRQVCGVGIAAHFLSVFIPMPLTAQEHCNALLTEGLKNVQRSTETKEWNNYMFHQICRKTNSGWSVDLGIFDLGDLGIGSSKAEQFCEEQANKSQGRIGESSEVSILTADALRAWNQCQRLADEKVRIETSFGDTFIEFAVSRGKGVKAKLDAVYFDKSVASCEVAGGSGPTKKISSGQKLAINMNEEDHHIHCERKVITTVEGAETVPRGQVTVKTSYGDLLVVLPQEERYSPALASELRKLIEANQTALTALRAEAFPSRSNNPMQINVVQVMPHDGFWGDWTTPVFCPENHYVCGARVRIEADLGTGGDDTALNAVHLQCCPF